MFIKTKTIKGNDYFYLIESQRVEGKSHPIPKTVAYLGNRDAAIAALEAMDLPGKERLILRVSSGQLATGKNKGKRGRPRKTADLRQESFSF